MGPRLNFIAVVRLGKGVNLVSVTPLSKPCIILIRLDRKI
jgi:hypothetical protein